MKPIVPARLVGGAILSEAMPIGTGVSRVYRGVDLGRPLDEIASGPKPGAPRGSPFRDAPRVAPALAPVPVIVRELSPFAVDEGDLFDVFEEATLARAQMTGSPTPRLLHTFGRGDKLMASVEEYVYGTPLEDVLRELRARGAEMPVPIALAIAQGLLPMWLAAASTKAPIRLLVDPATVLLDAAGRVRALPEYSVERARQAVGAALLLLSSIVSFTSPEQIMGEEPDTRSPMFTLGLLLYEMIGGAHPNASTGATMFEILSRTTNQDAPPLRERRAGVHPSVAQFVHRCLARDPEKRFSSWHELGRALAAVQALFPPTGPAEIAAYVRGVVPAHPTRGMPPVADPNAWGAIHRTGYHAVALRTARGEGAPAMTESRARRMPVIDPFAVYAGVDARPMYAVSEALLVDARPVTRAEFERFLIVTRTPRPAHIGEPSPLTDDAPCALVTVHEAEAYARWAGKRLPTEAEWEAAVTTLGAARLETGEVWEWTATPHESGGNVVRGGRWRDQASMEPRPDNRSFATSPAADLGFRCVAEVRRA